MLNIVFNTSCSLLHRSRDFHPSSTSDEQLRMRFLALTLAAMGVVLALAIVAGIGARVW